MHIQPLDIINLLTTVETPGPLVLLYIAQITYTSHTLLHDTIPYKVSPVPL